MNKPLTANFKVTETHDFLSGEYLLKVIDTNQLANFIVEEVISSKKVRIRSILIDGTYSQNCEVISGSELKKYIKNRTANELAKELMYRKHANA